MFHMFLNGALPERILVLKNIIGNCLGWCHDCLDPRSRAIALIEFLLDLPTFCLFLWEINAKCIIKKERQVSLFHTFWGRVSCCQPCTLKNTFFFFLSGFQHTLSAFRLVYKPKEAILTCECDGEYHSDPKSSFADFLERKKWLC